MEILQISIIDAEDLGGFDCLSLKFVDVKSSHSQIKKNWNLQLYPVTLNYV